VVSRVVIVVGMSFGVEIGIGIGIGVDMPSVRRVFVLEIRVCNRIRYEM